MSILIFYYYYYSYCCYYYYSSICLTSLSFPSSLVSFKARLILPYQLTQVVLEKRPLNCCSSSSSLSFCMYFQLGHPEMIHRADVLQARRPSRYITSVKTLTQQQCLAPPFDGRFLSSVVTG